MQNTCELCGFVLVDKPRGPSSHEITTYVKKLFNARKAGHAGTLDPKVSGVMIIGLNKATKLLRFVTKDKKKYVGVMKLHNPPKSIHHVQAVMDKFVGNISQIPPKHSAVAKRKRMRQVFTFRALEMDGRKILFEAQVQAGTYIRNLCVDVAKSFGGGYMAELRRTHVAKFSEYDCVSLPYLADSLCECKSLSQIKSLIKPCEQILTLPVLKVRRNVLEAICRGLPLAVSGVAFAETRFATGDYVSLSDDLGRIIAVGIANVSSSDLPHVAQETIAVHVKIVLE